MNSLCQTLIYHRLLSISCCFHLPYDTISFNMEIKFPITEHLLSTGFKSQKWNEKCLLFKEFNFVSSGRREESKLLPSRPLAGCAHFIWRRPFVSQRKEQNMLRIYINQVLPSYNSRKNEVVFTLVPFLPMWVLCSIRSPPLEYSGF